MSTQRCSSWLLLVLGFTQAAVALAAPSEQDLPPPPSIVRDVNLIWDGQYSRPQIPPYRTTSDGRIGLQFKTRTDKASEKAFRFYLLAPEKISGSFQSSSRGAGILASTIPVELPRSSFVGTTEAGESIHSAICETDTLPKICGVDGTSDCYRFNVITPFYNKQRSRMEFWRTPTEVEVESAKTSSARIARITTRKSVLGTSWPNISSLLETVMTADGRLLVGRVANSPVTWTNTATGVRRTSHPNVIYGYIPQNANACDVAQLRGPYPITHAHYHNVIRGNYGFAAYPLRDGTGRPIPDGIDFGGSYAWIDSLGKNLFFGTFQKSIQTADGPAFQLRCVGGGQCDNPDENRTKDTMGVSVAGLWTKGRTVLLDNALNNIDWNLQARPGGHVEAKLYQSDLGWVHVGSGRDNSNDNAGHMPPGGVGNINFIDSLEHKMNAFPAMRPSVPRDVAWWVSSGKTTDIVAFDDWVNPNVLITSEMVQAIEGNALEPSLSRLQNAATGNLFNAPRYGEIIGSGRVEPVALGGVHGKGFFNSSATGIRYQIPGNQNAALARQDWYVGLFIDPRFRDDGQRRRLIEFPDGSAIDLQGRNSLVYAANAQATRSLTLPETLETAQYHHLAFRFRTSGEIEFFFNGVLADRWTGPAAWANAFKIQGGSLWVGRGQSSGNGFIGWMDEFKVIAKAGAMNAEEICNYASGSITALTNQAATELRNKAAALPALGQNFIRQSLPSGIQYPSYLCFTENRSSDGWVDLNNLPRGVVSLRNQILLPEGPLVADKPRPDSSKNGFCLSCHLSDGTGSMPRSLTINALTPANINAEEDSRRQPTQPPAKLYGNVPVGVFGRNLPASHIFADDGIFVDRYVLQGE